MLPATILWGASFPLTLACGDSGRAVASGRAAFDRHVARINAINTSGALLGAIAFTLIGIPSLGSHAAQQLLVAIAAAGGLMLMLAAPGRARPRRLLSIAAATAL